MVIHAFGGYYGLAISWVLYRPNLHQSKRLIGSVYHSDVFAMIGKWAIIGVRSPLNLNVLMQSTVHVDISLSVFITIKPQPFAYKRVSPAALWLTVLPHRHTVPVDVLAQFQLSHHGPRRRTAQNGHQHLPCSRVLCPHHCCHLQHVSEERKTGHGEACIV